jgi:hypothetical protein
MKNIDAEMRAKNQKGAKLDFASSKKQELADSFSKADFETALKKASRKVAPKKA